MSSSPSRQARTGARRPLLRPTARAILESAPGTPGWTLAETLVALLLVLLALLLVGGLLTAQWGLSARASAQGEALAALEGVLEEVRAGALTLENHLLEQERLPFPLLHARGARLRLDVEPDGVEDLYRVRGRIEYAAGRRLESRALETLVWAP